MAVIAKMYYTKQEFSHQAQPNMTTIKTRFAPSPTGYMHLGNARTALFNALFAIQQNGIFLLRIEDTDQERSQDKFVQQLKQDLLWLGLDWQEGPEQEAQHKPYFQSQRLDIYAKYYKQLQEMNLAYPCFCSEQELKLSRKLQRIAGQAPRYAGTCAHLSPEEVENKLAQGLKPTLRFRVPRDEWLEYTDIVKGAQKFASNDIGDFIIRRADNTPAFFFCNAVDDALMQVTHVFRGEDHLTNTPRQLMILRQLNLPIPEYGHIALIVGDDAAPLSKRNGSLSIQELQQNGWQAGAVINYLARLGHSFEQEKGYASYKDLAADFKLQRLGKAAAKFDKQQLLHWQQAAIAAMAEEDLWQQMGTEIHNLVPSDLWSQFVIAVRPNIQFPVQAYLWAIILFRPELDYQTEALEIIKNTPAVYYQHALQALVQSEMDYKLLIKNLQQLTGLKAKNLFMPLRAALTGQTHGPEMAAMLNLIGLEIAQQRLQQALKLAAC